MRPIDADALQDAMKFVTSDPTCPLHIPPEPYTGALRVVVKWCFPVKAKHRDGEWHTNKPDADNLCKALYDIMSRLGFWKDDRQIASSITEKFWAEIPGIYVRIEVLA